MGKLKLLLAALGVVGGLFKFLPSALGFLGPVGAALGAVVTFLGQIVKWFFEGVTIILTHPVTFVTVGGIALFAFGGGVRLGVKWDAHLVTKAEATINQMIEDGKKADADNQRKLAEALAAKQKAEDDAAKNASAPASQPKRVRKPAAGKSAGADIGSWLSGLFPVSGKSK